MNKVLLIATMIALFSFSSFSETNKEDYKIPKVCESSIKKFCTGEKFNILKSVRECVVDNFQSLSNPCQKLLKEKNHFYHCLEASKKICPQKSKTADIKECLNANKEKFKGKCQEYLNQRSTFFSKTHRKQGTACREDVQKECKHESPDQRFNCLLERHKRGELSESCATYKKKHFRVFRDVDAK